MTWCASVHATLEKTICLGKCPANHAHPMTDTNDPPLSQTHSSTTACHIIVATTSKGWLHRIDLETKVNTTPSVQ